MKMKVALIESKPSRNKFFELFQNKFEFDSYVLCSNPQVKKVLKRDVDIQFNPDDYDWVILLVNNMVNVQYDWPMTNYQMYKTLESEYDDPYGTIHHYETDTIGLYKAGQYVDETFYNGTHKLNIDGAITTKNGNEICRPVTVAEWFHTENEKKREIFLLKSEYLTSFVNDFRKQNLYKKYGNYINQQLKKTG